MTEYKEWLGDKPVHPVASIFPMIDGEELQALADDIKENGQQEAIILAYEDFDQVGKLVVVDGRNRFAACKLAGVEPNFAVNGALEPSQIGTWIISHNLHRRHLTDRQRSAVAAKYVEHYEEEARENHRKALIESNQRRSASGNPASANLQKLEPVHATAKAADLFNVSERNVASSKKVMKEDPELFEQIEKNEIAPYKAEQIVRDRKKAEPTAEEIAARQVRQVASEVSRILNKGDLFAALVRDGLIEALNTDIEGDSNE